MASNTIIKGRPKAGPVIGLVLSALFAVAMTAIATSEHWLVAESDFAVGEPAPITVRVPPFRGLRGSDGQLSVGGGSIGVARGATVGATEAQVIGVVYGSGASRVTTAAAHLGAFFLMALLYTGYLRRSPRGRLLRMQVVSMALTVALAAVVKLLLLFTAASVFLVPVATGAVVAAVAIDLYGGLATALIVGAAAALASPFDTGVVTVLTVQGITTVLCIGDGRRNIVILGASLVGGVAAALTYAVFYYLSQQEVPLHELSDPLRSGWFAALLGGAISGLIAIAALPVYQWLLGEITRNRLVELADLSNPLLRQIAEKSPGTWQHSLAMANMAEVAANTIGANGRLVRVGAYYHDLGKSLQPKYFIENLGPGESSPHDNLPPQVSCDAIFAHVTEGVRLGRKEGLPERVIDFMHMHHGDGLLEYFWGKCQEQGNPEQLREEDFRYPGLKPQTRETAILAVCDAVEAASRTLKQPDARAIENLVQRIVYGKLHLGQLDESGLSMSELRRMSNSLIETIKHAHHVRVEYPWQREQREAEARERAEEQLTAAASPRGQDIAAARLAARYPRAATSRLINEPPLDSLDVPRAYWRTATDGRERELGMAATERVSTDEQLSRAESTTAPDRPDTDPVADAETGDQVPASPKRAKRALEIVDDAELPPEPDLDDAAALDVVDDAAIAAITADAGPRDGARAHPAVEAPPARADSADGDATGTPDLVVAPGVRPTRPDAITEPPPTAAPEPIEDEAATGPRTRAPRPSAPMAATLLGAGVKLPRSKPPPPPKRAKPTTIELMKGDIDSEMPSPLAPAVEAPLHVESHRAQSEDGALEPGVMVVGPPPKTQPRRGAGSKDDD